MQEVNIYIDVKHTGRLKTGTGTYSIVLEYIKDGSPRTRELFEGLNHTTKNRTALTACVVALEHMIKTCNVQLFINSHYVEQTFNQGWFANWDLNTWTSKGKPIKNADLWQQLLELTYKYSVEYLFSETNQYSAYMATMIKRVEIEYQEDKQNV